MQRQDFSPISDFLAKSVPYQMLMKHITYTKFASKDETLKIWHDNLIHLIQSATSFKQLYKNIDKMGYSRISEIAQKQNTDEETLAVDFANQAKKKPLMKTICLLSDFGDDVKFYYDIEIEDEKIALDEFIAMNPHIKEIERLEEITNIPATKAIISNVIKQFKQADNFEELLNATDANCGATHFFARIYSIFGTIPAFNYQVALLRQDILNVMKQLDHDKEHDTIASISTPAS